MVETILFSMLFYCPTRKTHVTSEVSLSTSTGYATRIMDPATANELAASSDMLVLVTKQVDPDPDQTRYGNWFALWNICFRFSYWF